jgi:hypothetical protein
MGVIESPVTKQVAANRSPRQQVQRLHSRFGIPLLCGARISWPAFSANQVSSGFITKCPDHALRSRRRCLAKGPVGDRCSRSFAKWIGAPFCHEIKVSGRKNVVERGGIVFSPRSEPGSLDCGC